MKYFLYKDVAGAIEYLSKEGVEEFLPSLILNELEAEPKDYYEVLGSLESSGVLKRKFITNLNDEDESYEVVQGRELGKHNPDDVYVMYEIQKEFAERLNQ